MIFTYICSTFLLAIFYSLMNFSPATIINAQKASPKFMCLHTNKLTHQYRQSISTHTQTHTQTHLILLRQISTHCLDQQKLGRLSRCMRANMCELLHRCVSGWTRVLVMNWVVCLTLMKGQSAYGSREKE